MSEKIVGTHDGSGSHGASSTAASRLLSMTNVWSDAPSPLPAPEPAPVPPPVTRPAPVAQAAAPVEIVTIAAPVAPVQPRSSQWPPQRVSLALQGGGTFAAFTWGVLERLLEHPTIQIDTISGASAGAINALLLASGLAEGGREGAHSRLNRFWARLMHEASFRSLMLVGGFSPAGSSVAFGPTLRSGQFDPFDYAVVAPIVAELVEHRTSPGELVRQFERRALDPARFAPDDQGRTPYDKLTAESFRAIVDDAFRRMRRSVYKRMQGPPIVVVSERAFGFDLRETIINGWNG